jgi:hypothetical protein
LIKWLTCGFLQCGTQGGGAGLTAGYRTDRPVMIVVCGRKCLVFKHFRPQTVITAIVVGRRRHPLSGQLDQLS